MEIMFSSWQKRWLAYKCFPCTCVAIGAPNKLLSAWLRFCREIYQGWREGMDRNPRLTKMGDVYILMLLPNVVLMINRL